MQMKPNAPACERNQDPISVQLKRIFAETTSVLEIGSGTGQHAVFMGKSLPHLSWQTSDLVENHSGIKQWLEAENLTNVKSPIELQAGKQWPNTKYDAIFTANTLHIMSRSNAMSCIKQGAEVLNCENGKFVAYGPFNYNGKFTSESNEKFEQWLKSRNPESGIRNFEDLCQSATDSDLELISDIEMPANNRLLVWQKIKR